jgi:uncharacterized protein
MMNDFYKKYGPLALVAGASEGLGEAFARALAKRGLDLVLIARRQEKLEALSKALREEYRIRVQYAALDLADISAVSDFVSSLDKGAGLLVYNAAYAPILPFEKVSETQLETVVNVNVRAPLLLCKMLSQSMIERQRGGILLMSSLAGLRGSPGLSAYSASKAFNIILAESLWAELKSKGIDVMTTCAGAISTPGYERANNKGRAPGTLTPIKVAEASLKALGKGPVYVPGLTNKAARLFLGRLFPGKAAITIMQHQTEHLS